jgi:Sulfocyanin (SoxE) domain
VPEKGDAPTSFLGLLPERIQTDASSMRQTWSWAAMVALVLLAATGCGGTAHRVLPLVPITERDFRIAVPRLVPAGDVRIVLKNKGPVSHELLIIHATGQGLPRRADGFTVDEDAVERRLVGHFEAAGPGTRDLVLHLTPGRYVVFCNMSGHAASGMLTSFRVR